MRKKDLLSAMMIVGDAGNSDLVNALKETLANNVVIYFSAQDRKSTRLNSSHVSESRMPSSA